jgi:hypothetical protein
VRRRANVFLVVGVVVALQVLFPTASLAKDGGNPGEPARQAGEDRWVPSLAITGGGVFQQQKGFTTSGLFIDRSGPPEAIQPDGVCRPGDPPPCPIVAPAYPLPVPISDDDLGVAPFVGASLELMSPALPIPTRPRLFASGEILPAFAFERDLALQGDPDCVRGPRPGEPCASEDPVVDAITFEEDAANGEGIRTSAKIDTLVFGASLGVAFPFRIGNRQLRIKPAVGWLSYKVEAEGFLVDAACNPATRCTDTLRVIIPSLPPIFTPGFLRETTLSASASRRFHGIGPGLDVEMDTIRFGPLGVSLFMGGGAYRTLGNRRISFGAARVYVDELRATASDPDALTNDLAVAKFEVEVDPWIYRAHVGIRFRWLGSPD